jgi:cytoskeleton protein RodZ
MTVPKKPDTEPTQPKVQGPGAGLRAAREARGLSLEKVADELHLSSAMVAAIERDDYEALPGSVFVRGYLKNYARLMELSMAQVLESYERSRPAEHISTPVVKGNIKAEVSSDHTGVRLVTWAIVLVLAALVFSWWKGYIDWDSALEGTPDDENPPAPDVVSPPLTGPGPTSLPPLVPEPAIAAPAAPASAIQTEPESGPESAPAPVEVVALAEEQPGAEQGIGNEPVQSPPPEPTLEPEVVFGFSGPCWVNVRDSKGQRQLFGEMGEGDRKRIEGKPPWSVVLGNSRVVRITIDGEVFDHTRYSIGNVARFTLSPSER